MELNNYKVSPKQSIKLEKFPTEIKTDKSKEEIKEERMLIIKNIDDLQYAMYAENKQALLIVFQGIDAAGKDSSIRALFSGLNPAGVVVSSFKTPSKNELEHDYLWRHYLQLPERGKIRVFNRSHYENVLVTQVHKNYLLNENLPDIHTEKEANDAFFEKRYEDINHFEQHLTHCGTQIIKFFLHISKEEQKNRFIERVNDPSKNYKFSAADLKERNYWDDYQNCFEKMLSKTSTTYAPWYIIPCNNKKTAQLLMAEIIQDKIQKMNPQLPQLSEEEKQEMKELYQTMLSN